EKVRAKTRARINRRLETPTALPQSAGPRDGAVWANANGGCSGRQIPEFVTPSCTDDPSFVGFGFGFAVGGGVHFGIGFVATLVAAAVSVAEALAVGAVVGVGAGVGVAAGVGAGFAV